MTTTLTRINIGSMSFCGGKSDLGSPSTTVVSPDHNMNFYGSDPPEKDLGFEAVSKDEGTVTKTLPPPRPENSDVKKKGDTASKTNPSPTSAPIVSTSSNTDPWKNMDLKPVQPISHRSRVVSLDRREILYDEEDEDLEGNGFDSSSSSESVDPPTNPFAVRRKQEDDSLTKQRFLQTVHRHRRNVAEVASSESDEHAGKTDEDTSDGETSYFSGQLPSPKSATRKGYGNTNAISQYHRKSPTANALPGQPFIPPSNMKPMTPNYRLGNTSDFTNSRRSWQESDASLSLSPSCSSDDEDNEVLSPQPYLAERSNSAPSIKLNLVRSSNANEMMDDFCDIQSRGTVPLPRQNSDMSSHVSDSSDEDQEGAGPPIAVSLSDGAAIRSERTRGHRRDISALTDSSDLLRSLSPGKSSSCSGCEESDTDANSSIDSSNPPADLQNHLGIPNLHAINSFPSTGVANHSLPLNNDQTHFWEQGGKSDSSSSLESPHKKRSPKGNTMNSPHYVDNSGVISDSSTPPRKYDVQRSSNSTLQMNQIQASSQNTIMKYSDDETVESLGWNVDVYSNADLNDYIATAAEGGVDSHSQKANGKSTKKGKDKAKKKINETNSRNGASQHDSPENSNDESLDQGMRKQKSSMQPDDPSHANIGVNENQGQFSVYSTRWLMLFYISMLNLLSDWTCYSVAPIAILTSEAFGEVDPELLVTIFLGANAIATACEPIILNRLGLRRTILFGALLLMIGSAVKSGGIPWIIGTSLQKGQGDWRVYLGFFLVGLSQPLYQCTPALLSASWFPEKERTMATGVALNSNQLGIGCAFIFGTLLVHTSDDIPSYFGLLSFIATLTFVGCAIQFDDAPPTPPSNTARVMRGTLEVNLPGFDSFRGMISSTLGFPSNTMPPFIDDGKGQIHSSVRSYQNSSGSEEPFAHDSTSPKKHSRRKQKMDRNAESSRTETNTSRNRKSRRADGGETRNRRGQSSRTASSENGFRAGPVDSQHPSMGIGNESTCSAALAIADIEKEAALYGCAPPSAMWSQEGMPGQLNGNYRQQNVSQRNTRSRRQRRSNQQQNMYDDHFVTTQEQSPYMANNQQYDHNVHQLQNQNMPSDPNVAPDSPFSNLRNQGPQPIMGYQNPPNMPPHYNSVHVPPHVSMPRGYNTMNNQPWPPYQQYPQYYPQYATMPMHYPNQMGYQYYQQPYIHPHQMYQYDPHMAQFSSALNRLPQLEDPIDEGVEPVLVQAGHNLDIEIRDDQILLSIRACFSRPGFIQSLLAFVVSAIVINTLSTFMDYLVRLGGSGSEMVGIIGGSFQILIMCSSLVFGQITDHTRAYFSIVLILLVLGAFALAECGVNLDAARGTDLKWSLLVTAILVGPLQPVATELGVEVAYPLSENTVLVIQQLFANLMSALFIPCFKAVQDVGREPAVENEMNVRPQYTFSFYLLIVIHACSTVLFSTFNGHYLRLDHELEEKAAREREAQTDESLMYESSNYASSEEWLVPENAYKDPSGNVNLDAHVTRPLLV